MSLTPELDFGLWTAWWYTAAFGLTNLFLISIFPRMSARRLFRIPAFESWRERIVSYMSIFVFARALMVFAVFVPLRLNTIWFWIGTVVFFGCLVLHTVAMFDFAAAPSDEPVVTGAYRITRHPMQHVAVVMWLGVGVATLSWVICLVCLLQPFLSYPFLQAQERSCLEAYGERYRGYMQQAPRYFRPFA
jgi:protein-S-isoprenylcysteine O-methyltransferase Ste14